MRYSVLLRLVLILIVGLLAACGGPTPAQTVEPTQEPVLAPTEAQEEEPTAQPALVNGEVLLRERCAVCHGLDQVERAQKSREEWEQNVARMVSKGAELDENEQAILIEYLAETYGP